MRKYTLYSITLVINMSISAQNNKLFWDGTDWNKVSKNVDNDHKMCYRIKTAYLHGALDGRLFAYLKTWDENQTLADSVFSDNVDYLSNRELIRNLDFFYLDPLNSYIPIPTAIVIANMYGRRIPPLEIDSYIESTKDWINNLEINLDTLDYSKLLNEKWMRSKAN